MKALNTIPQSFDGKIQPQAVEFEEVVLGACMLEADVLSEIISILQAEMFYKPAHQSIYRAIYQLFNTTSNPVDLLTVTEMLKKNGELDIAGGAYYISQLTNRVASTANCEYHARIIQQKFLLRSLINTCTQTVNEAYADTTDVFDLLSKNEMLLSKITDHVFTSNFKMPLGLFLELRERNENILSLNGKLNGVTSGFRVIDEITGGWQKSTLNILGGAPGQGKTALALEFAKKPALQGIPVGFFSLEMSTEQLFPRMVSSESNIEHEKITRKGLSEWEMKTVDNYTKALQTAPIYFDDSNMTIFDVKNKARKLHKKYGIQLLIVDYLQLISSPDHKNNRANEVSYVSRSLKGLSKELDIPIIALCSILAKQVATRADRKPQLSDLKESGDIESDADLVMFLYRPEYYGIQQDDNNNSTLKKAVILIEKHRQGSLEKPIIGFEGKFTKFYSLNDNSENTHTLTPNTSFIEQNPF